MYQRLQLATALIVTFLVSMLIQKALQLWRALDVRGGHVLSHDMGTSVLTELLARHTLGLMPGWFDAGLQSATFTNGSMVLERAQLRIMQRVLLSPAGVLATKLNRAELFAQQLRSAHGVDGARLYEYT